MAFINWSKTGMGTFFVLQGLKGGKGEEFERRQSVCLYSNCFGERKIIHMNSHWGFRLLNTGKHTVGMR